ncbi:heterogeneous nuclear ribonucleoprotein A0 [Trifolium repens]|nr:heterogeneous nuclear ribonucleoprotein A0 [Trifolium repens]
MGWDDGEWTEVRRRCRKVHRQRDTGLDFERHGERFRRDDTSLSHRSYSSDRRTCYNPFPCDHRFRQDQSRIHFADSQQHVPRGFDHEPHAAVRAQEKRRWNDVVDGRQNTNVIQQQRQVEKPRLFPSYVNGMTAHVAGRNMSNSYGRQRYVSFYFTDFPVQLSHFYLLKGFEVCGMLEDIYVARKRNKQGQPYGFVRFFNVRDITKLAKALNAVCFGDFRVRARVATFDRNNALADETNVNGMEAGMLGDAKAMDKPKDHSLSFNVVKPLVEAKQRCENLAVTANRHGKIDEHGTQKQEDMKQEEHATVEGKDSRVYVRSYKAAPDDVAWARCGVVATIANREAGSVVRRRLEDAGFKGLELIHLRGARVLVRSLDGTEVLAVLDGAKDFFSMCFSHWIVEEWGYELGNDACLLEDDTMSKASPAAEDVFHCDPKARRPRDQDLRQFKTVLEPVVSRPEASEANIACVAETEMLLVSTWPGQLGEVPRVPVCPQKMVKVGMTQAQCHNIGGAGVLFSSKRRSSPGGGVVGDQLKKAVWGQPKTKAKSFLQHSLFSLKRIARLPINDHREVLQILQKNARKRRPRGAASRSRATGSRASAEDGHSSSSINNDWKHRVAMQGRDHAVEDDIMEVGKFVGATFKGDTTNMLSVLSKSGTGRRDSMGAVQGVATLQEQARGLGRVDKLNEVREKNPLVVCLQETKLQACDDFLCTAVWGSSPFGFSFCPSSGASGGLLTIWDTTEVEMWSSLDAEFLQVHRYAV